MVLVLGVGRCAFRPPRVVFVLGLVSLINSLTSGKKVGKRVGKSWGRIRHPRGGGDYRPVGRRVFYCERCSADGSSPCRS